MKHRKFNKFGGTECRTKDQISTYVLFINWILKYQEKNSFKNEDDVEKAFRKFCDDENIYKYKKTDSIKRFKMICSNLDKDLHIFHFDNIKKKYNLDDKFDLRNPSRSFLFFMQNAWPESNYPFKQMLKFMHENPNCNDANKLSHAFMVYDGKEPFKDLYEMNVIDQIVDNECKDIKLTGKLESFITFNKPIKYISLIKEIYKKKYNGLKILESDLKDFKKRDKYLYGIIYDNQRKIRFSNARNFAKNLNEIDTITFLKRLKKAQLKSNIDQEYCDLFNRWMHGIGLANSTSTKETKYLSCRIYLENGNYFINIPNNQPCFPFTLKQCIENLKKIQDEKYIDIKSTLSLNDTPNSAIAEYFVNLFFLL